MRKTFQFGALGLMACLSASLFAPIVSQATGDDPFDWYGSDNVEGAVNIPNCREAGEHFAFTDVPEKAWYARGVWSVAADRIVSGYKDVSGKSLNKFGPTDSITLVQALKIAILASGYDVQSYNGVYTKTQKTWFAPYYDVATQEGFGIFVGATENPNDIATRGLVARIFTDAFFPNQNFYDWKNLSNPYTDVREQDGYWTEPILRLTQDGVLTGDTTSTGKLTGRFRPQDTITRAEVAAIAERARRIYGTPGAPKEESATMIDYTDSGFSPQKITLPCGARVIFRNKSSSALWPLSDCNEGWAVPYCYFDAGKELAPGAEFSAHVEERQTISYWNKLRTDHKGTIEVRGSPTNP